jgi:hypothetical protein
MKTDKKATRRCLTHVVAAALLCLFAVGASAVAVNVQSDKAAERAAKIEGLRSVLRDEGLRKSDPGRVYKAIEELGREKATEAIPELVQLLSFEKEVDTSAGDFHIVTIGERYPAAGALYQIGEDALPALVQVVGTEDEDSLAGRNALYSIDAILVRKSPADAVNFLEGEASRAASPEAALRLSKAADKTKRLLIKKPTP